MQYISAQSAANRWGMSPSSVQALCASGEIKGAARVGNMWVLPKRTEKPGTEKHCKTPESAPAKQKHPIRIVRNKLRMIIQKMLQQCSDEGVEAHCAKLSILTMVSAELLLHSIQQSPYGLHEGDILQSVRAVAQVTGYPVTAETLKCYQGQRKQFRCLLEDYPFCCDDILSWCYQYINKFGSKSDFWNTQFFTEKYMITTLVDAIGLERVGKILDPACGGGNFLLYCFDVLAGAEELSDPVQAVQKLDVIRQKLFGYEIDPELAMVASVNLRLKYLSTLATHGCKFGVDDFLHFSPNIFYPKKRTTAGALDVDPKKQYVCKWGSRESYELLSTVFCGVEVIITNPPFQTIKGMPQPLKAYLKEYYPAAKCDMCNGFLQMLLSTVAPGGMVGVVSQNSWLYLDSFTELRRELMKTHSLLHIWELGSNAFYDLSGEKANAVLTVWKKEPPQEEHQLKWTSLKEFDQAAIEACLSGQQEDRYTSRVRQREIAAAGGAFNLAGTEHLRSLLIDGPHYGSYATPMQGTSTGNAKELIDFYWKHSGDPDWIPVSKGGGYARWRGLNYYCVKWGTDGSYIKATQGSAIRNAAYFSETSLVFSDTGTAGLNARILLDGQIFVASGPGIRGIAGNPLAHLAFLNSRLSSYYIHLISPKLTVAAGYIAKLPAVASLLNSDRLGGYAKICLDRKRRRLQKRPQNLEFIPVRHSSGPLADCAHQWFLEDLCDEWIQLFYEHKIEEEINRLLRLSAADIAAIDRRIGAKQVMEEENGATYSIERLGDLMQKHMSTSCTLTCTRANRNSLGCDGIIEYLSQETGTSCEEIFRQLFRSGFYPGWLEKKYTGLYLHALVLSAMEFPAGNKRGMTAGEITERAGIREPAEAAKLEDWLASEFNHFHPVSLMNAPLYCYRCGAVVHLEGDTT